MRIYYDKDCNIEVLKGKKVAVIGYGSRHAHANNLKDSGIDVIVGLRADSTSVKKAENAGLKVLPTSEAAKIADVIMILLPDEIQGDVYREEIGPFVKQGAYLVLANGFNIHFARSFPVMTSMSSWLLQGSGPLGTSRDIQKAAECPV
jgi:ketol-acid reductoisomerase